MSRFGTNGTFSYDPGDTFAAGTGIDIEVQDMSQFPFQTDLISDSIEYRTKSGQKYEYENFNKQRHVFVWSDLRETKRDELFTMIKSLPILTFSSPPDTLWGTYRVTKGSWDETETTHERYNVSFSIEEE